MKFKRLFRDLLLCELVEEPSETEGGIILPSETVPQKAKVLMQGPGRLTRKGRLVTMDTKIGDTVYFSRLSEHAYPGMEKGHVIISESTILGVEHVNIN